MASSLVRELQQDALNPEVRVSTLLRKALVVARKLNVREIEEWINRELSGYPTEVEHPEYRHLHGEVKWRNPYHPWTTVVFGDGVRRERLAARPCGQGVGQLEALLTNRGHDGEFVIHYPPELAHKASEGWANEMALFVSAAAVSGVLDAVRDALLKWALELEARGIVGEGLSFTDAEQKTAATMATNVAHIYGPVQNYQVQQGSDQSTQTAIVVSPLDLDKVSEIVRAITQGMATLKLSHEAEAELKADVATMQAQLGSPTPKPGVIRECLQSARRVLEGAGGSAAGELAIRIGALFFS